jgi:hypothetical protein
MNMTPPKTDLKLEEDPYLRLGFGMNAYYDTLKYLVMLMLLIFVFSLPSMYIYKSYSGLAAEPMYGITRYSLGNMGGAYPLCKFVPLESEFISMQCSSGYLHPQQGDFGVTPLSSEDKNLCLNGPQNSYC